MAVLLTLPVRLTGLRIANRQTVLSALQLCRDMPHLNFGDAMTVAAMTQAASDVAFPDRHLGSRLVQYHQGMNQRNDLAGTRREQVQGPGIIKVPITIEPQAEGGYAVRSPILPELITEGATIEDAAAQVPDAVAAVLELYEDLGKPLPVGIVQEVGPVSYEALISRE